MRWLVTGFLVSTVVCCTAAFAPLPSKQQHAAATVSLKMGYVPDGFTPEQWKKKQQKEKQAKSEKNFAAFGPQSFKSRSLQAFQKDLERGKTSHLMPVMNAKARVKKGEIKAEDVPYMQRGGSWDNTDVKGAKKRKWSKADQKYEEDTKTSPTKNAWDWNGTAPRRGPTTGATKKQGDSKPPTKKLFGMW